MTEDGPGAVALALVLIHVGPLFVLAPDDALFAMSPDGPTRARMALLATIALVAVVLVGALRRRLPLDGATWRILHAFLAVLVILLGFGHALLTDGALDGAGTVVLASFGALALAGIAAASLHGPGAPPASRLTAGRKTSEQPRVVPAQGTRGGRECRADKPGMAAKLCASCGCSSAG